MATKIFRIKNQLVQTLDNGSNLVKSKYNSVQSVVNNIELPERFKGGLVEKWAKYWKHLYIDYRDVFVNTGTHMKEHPIKTAFYGITGSAAYYFTKRNPSEADFFNQLRQFNTDMVLVHPTCHKPEAAEYLRFLEQCNNAGILRRFTFGVFSVIWLDNYSRAVSMYKANCTYLKPQYLTWHQRIIDVGVLGRWRKLEQKMIDFDVNDENLN